MDQSDYNEGLLYKIVIIGDTGTGKTNIITKYVSNSFDVVSRPTIGVEFFQKELTLNLEDGSKKDIRLQIWDTAGQERFRGMASSYYRKAFGVLVVYDITNRESFNNLDKWLDEIHSYVDRNIEIVLLGNKKDLVDDRQVTLNEGLEFSKKNKLLFYETSALDDADNNISEMFKQLAVSIYENDQLRIAKELVDNDIKNNSRNLVEAINTKDKGNKRCC